MVMLPSRRPAKLLPRADFKSEDLRAQVWKNGVDVVWEQCVLCPCGQRVDNYGVVAMGFAALGPTLLTGEAKTACATCGGKGYIQMSAQPIKVLMFSQAFQGKRFSTNGDMESGAAKATFLPENKPTDGDRITLTNSVHVLREKHIRKTTVESLRFPIASQVQDLETGPVSLSVLTLMRASLDNVTDPTPLVLGTDFTVDNQGRIVWSVAAGSRAPVVGAQYAVEYYAKPRYVVTGTGHKVRDTTVGFKKSAPTPTVLTVTASLQAEWKGAGNAA